MKMKHLFIALAVCILAVVSATNSLADEFNRKIVFTFDKPVSIPPVHRPGWGVLPPGTYVFKIFDSTTNRHIVQIFNKDQTEIYATILALPNMRMKVTDKPVLTFRETPVGQPFALEAMFYPGRQWGEQFVYPKSQAVAIAQATSEPVLSMPISQEEPLPDSPRVIAELEKTPVTAVEPSGTEVETAQVVTPPTPEEYKAAAAEPEALPQTGSPLPLIGLVGLLALGVGFTVRFAEKRIG
jgi:hypothetical protein